MGDSHIEELFEKATQYVRTATGNLDTDTLLYLYSRYKQATEGPCNIPRPGFFDFQGKQKWDAWKKLGDKSKPDAMKDYIQKTYNTDPDWLEKLEYGVTEGKPSGTGMGVGVSTMSPGEDDLPDEQKDIFDWCKEGDVGHVMRILTNSNEKEVNRIDDEGMCLLHWACDRGHNDIVKLLLKFKANINAQDAEGQTPLHYAVSCEHKQVIQTLLASGADCTIADVDNMTASQATDNPDILALLS